MDLNQTGVDRLLRSSLAAPVPTLPLDFEKKLQRELRPPAAQARYPLILLSGYGLVSVVTSALLMSSQGVPWTSATALIGTPLLLTLATLARRWSRIVARRSAH